MIARTKRDAEWAARRAEGIINLALETTVGAAIGGGAGIQSASLSRHWSPPHRSRAWWAAS